MKFSKISIPFFFAVFQALTFNQVHAAGDCSPYLGLATLNEFFKDQANQSNDADDFVEVKILDSSIPSAIYSQWTIQVCEDNEPGNSNDADGCSPVIDLGDFTDTVKPWLVLKDGSIGRYMNFKTKFDAILLDSNDDVIDYVSVDGNTDLEEAGCTGASLPYDYQAGQPGNTDKFIFRKPDGTGDWDFESSASVDGSEDASNDGTDAGPNLTFSDVTVIQGETSATITLTLDATSSDDITLNFSTIDGTLSAGTDYTSVNTSGTISAGDSSVTFTIPISATSGVGDFYFFVSVAPASTGLATLTNHLGTVNVIANVACGAIGVTQAGYGGAEIIVDGDATNNGSNMANGTYTGDAVLDVGSTTPTTGTSYTLPGLDPSSLPSNVSTTDDTMSDGETINASTDIYYDEITVNSSNSASLTGGGPFHIRKLTIDDTATLNVAAGIYYVDEFEMLGNGTLNVTSEPVIFYIGTDFEIKEDGSVTGSTITGLRVYMLNGSDEVEFEDNADFTGMVYAPYGADIEVQDNATVNAQLVTLGELTLEDNAALTFSAADSTLVSSVSTCEVPTTAVLDNFVINVGGGSANTCNPFNFTVTARDSSNTVLTEYDGTVTLSTSTSHGIFASVAPTTNSITDTTDDGSATFTFHDDDDGVVTLSLANERAETLTITVEDGTIPVTTTSSNVTFSDNAFTITDVDLNVAGDNVPVAGRNHSYQIQMIQKNPTDPSDAACTAASGYNGAKPLKMWRTKDAADPSSVDPQLDGNPLPDADPGVTNGSISFTSGVANVSLSTLDIGKYTIELADISNSFAAVTISGSSDPQTVRPFGIGIDFSNLRDADFANGGLDGSDGDISYAVDETGSIFTQAGEDFPVTVQGVLHDPIDDSDDDGVPDENAYLGNNLVAPSFGQEGGEVTLSATVVAPGSASLGALTGNSFGSFTSGSQTADMTYSNVGIINLNADLTTDPLNYFGSVTFIAGPDDTAGHAPNVGRFNPYQYSVTASSVTSGCSVVTPYTYAREPFTGSVTIQAENKAGNLTDGYVSGFDTLDVTSELTILNSATSLAYDLQTITVTETFDAVTAGSAQFDLDLRWDMPLGPVTTTTANLTASTDEVTLIAGSPVALGATEIRFGRLAMKNVFGSELNDLTMPMQTEYYDGNNFIVNIDDGCTTIDLADLGVTAALSGGSSTVSVFSSPAIGGILNVSLTAPGASNVGDITVIPNLLLSGDDWLQFDWDGDTFYDNNPVGVATFGIFSGDSRQIYFRQIYR